MNCHCRCLFLSSHFYIPSFVRSSPLLGCCCRTFQDILVLVDDDDEEEEESSGDLSRYSELQHW